MPRRRPSEFTDYERTNKTLELLGSMLKLEHLPRRLESYDISNLGSDDIVASMVVFVDGNSSKKDYKRFKLRDMDGPNDYGSMQQVIERRFTHFLAGDKGFAERRTHCSLTAVRCMRIRCSGSFPPWGSVFRCSAWSRMTDTGPVRW